MDFYSDFGIGEICIVNNKESERVLPEDGRRVPDQLVKVIAITFTSTYVEYHCEWFSSTGQMQRAAFNTDQLTGDPSFDKHNGYNDRDL